MGEAGITWDIHNISFKGNDASRLSSLNIHTQHITLRREMYHKFHPDPGRWTLTKSLGLSTLIIMPSLRLRFYLGSAGNSTGTEHPACILEPTWDNDDHHVRGIWLPPGGLDLDDC